MAASPARSDAAPHSGNSGASTSRGRGSSRPLSREEIDEVLQATWWGTLATVEDGRPYAVPVAYGRKDDVFYIASREGRKIRNLKRNPHVCLTVVEMKGSGDWRSVVVTGVVQWVTGPLETLESLAALRHQCRQPMTARVDAKRLLGAKFLKIVPEEITGRSRS